MPLLATVTAASLQGQTFPPLSFAVDGLVSEGLTLLAGSPKVGKSWLSLDLALAVASGGLALGAIPVDQGGAVVLALEDGLRRLQDRIGLLHGDQPWPDDLHLVVQRPEHPLTALDDHLERHPGTRLVVVDTLAKVRPPSRGGDANAYQEDYRFAGALQQWATERRVCLLALHHDRKVGSVDFVQAVSGTFGLTGAADSILLLTRDRGADDGLLQLTGRDLSDDFAWQLSRVGPAWQLVDKVRPELAAATANFGDRSAAVARFVVEALTPVSAAEVGDALGIERDTAKRYLSRLAEAGRITRTSRGLYAGPEGIVPVPLSQASRVSPSPDPLSLSPDRERDTWDGWDTGT
jgi:hypothetical protein